MVLILIIYFSLVTVMFIVNCRLALKKKGVSGLEDYLTDLSILTSVRFNVFGQYLFNNLLTKPNGYKFGSRKDTFGYAMAINKRLKTLTNTGLRIENIFNFFNKNHLEKSIANKKPCI